MTEDRQLADRVRQALAGVPQVEERRMFGSLGFLVDGTLRIAVGSHDDRVAMVRTGPDQAAALQRPGVAPMVMRGREMTGWVALTREAIDSDADVANWVAVGLAALPPVKVSSGADAAPATEDPDTEGADRLAH